MHSGPHTQLALLWHSQLALQVIMSTLFCSTSQYGTVGQQQPYVMDKSTYKHTPETQSKCMLLTAALGIACLCILTSLCGDDKVLLRV